MNIHDFLIILREIEVINELSPKCSEEDLIKVSNSLDKIDEYMYYYNNERYQWSRNKMTPVQYRSHLLLV